MTFTTPVDGLPDAFEQAEGLDPLDPVDAAQDQHGRTVDGGGTIDPVEQGPLPDRGRNFACGGHAGSRLRDGSAGVHPPQVSSGHRFGSFRQPHPPQPLVSYTAGFRYRGVEG